MKAENQTAAVEKEAAFWFARLRSDELANTRRSSLLLAPPKPRLTVEIDGIY